MKITVEKYKWNTKEFDNKLLNKEGEYCIMGFIAKAFGLEDVDILDKTTLLPLFSLLPEKLSWIEKKVKWRDGSEFNSTEKLLNFLNDSPNSIKKKETDIKLVLGKVGIDVEFVTIDE